MNTPQDKFAELLNWTDNPDGSVTITPPVGFSALVGRFAETEGIDFNEAANRILHAALDTMAAA